MGPLHFFVSKNGISQRARLAGYNTSAGPNSDVGMVVNVGHRRNRMKVV